MCVCVLVHFSCMPFVCEKITGVNVIVIVKKDQLRQRIEAIKSERYNFGFGSN